MARVNLPRPNTGTSPFLKRTSGQSCSLHCEWAPSCILQWLFPAEMVKIAPGTGAVWFFWSVLRSSLALRDFCRSRTSLQSSIWSQPYYIASLRRWRPGGCLLLWIVFVRAGWRKTKRLNGGPGCHALWIDCIIGRYRTELPLWRPIREAPSDNARLCKPDHKSRQPGLTTTAFISTVTRLKPRWYALRRQFTTLHRQTANGGRGSLDSFAWSLHPAVLRSNLRREPPVGANHGGDIKPCR